MNFAALIVAAGMSTRMKQFKQLMNVGNVSMAQKVVNNFVSAGVTKIVMVTGYRAEELEKSLDGENIIFLRNQDYKTTQMFDSVKIGLNYLKDKCDKVFFTPVDIPFFKAETLKLLMRQNSLLTIPSFQNKSGHPILIDRMLVPQILSYEGSDGLKGALSSCCQKPSYVLVDDSAVLFDADTQADFEKLILAYGKVKEN